MEPLVVIGNHGGLTQAKKSDDIANSVASAPDRTRQSLIASEPDAPSIRAPHLHGVSNEISRPEFQRRTNTLLTAMLLVFLVEILRLARVTRRTGSFVPFTIIRGCSIEPCPARLT